jgi:hypothetical protein
METNIETNQRSQAQGFYAQPRIFMSKDGEYLIHVLPGNQRIRMHVNLYKKIMGINFVPKSKRPAA